MATPRSEIIKRLKQRAAADGTPKTKAPAPPQAHPLVDRLQERDPTLMQRGEVALGRAGSAIARTFATPEERTVPSITDVGPGAATVATPTPEPPAPPEPRPESTRQLIALGEVLPRPATPMSPDYLGPQHGFRSVEEQFTPPVAPEELVAAELEDREPETPDPITGGVVPAGRKLTGAERRQIPGSILAKVRNSEAMKGIRAGLEAGRVGIGETLETVGGLTGDPALTARGEELSARGRAGQEGAAGRVQRVEDIRSLEDFSDWAAFAMGQGIGSMAAPVAGGLAGGVAGGPLGAAIGALGPSYVMLLGEVRGELEGAGVDRGTVDKVAPLAAVPAAALEALLPGSIGAEAASGTATRFGLDLARRMLRRAAEGAVLEGATEGAQTAISRGTAAALSDELDFFTPETLSELVNASLAGALPGAAFGAGGAVIEGRAPGRRTSAAPASPGQTMAERIRQRAEAEAPAEPAAPAEPVAPTEERRGLRRRIADAIDPSRREELEEAFVDPMTGLPSPAAFSRARPRLDADPGMHVASFDISNLKAINDDPAFGRGVADERLAEVAQIIREEAEARGIDARNVFRAGGDEFSVAGPDPAVLEELVEAVRGRVEPMQVGSFTSHVRGGVGADWLSAERAAQEAKASETGPRARPGPKEESATGLDRAGSEMARGIGDSLRDALWAEYQKGSTTLAGGTENALIAAKSLRDEGVELTREQLVDLAEKESRLERGSPTYQDDMRRLMAEYVPQGAEPTPQERAAEESSRDQEAGRRAQARADERVAEAEQNLSESARRAQRRRRGEDVPEPAPEPQGRTTPREGVAPGQRATIVAHSEDADFTQLAPGDEVMVDRINDDGTADIVINEGPEGTPVQGVPLDVLAPAPEPKTPPMAEQDPAVREERSRRNAERIDRFFSGRDMDTGEPFVESGEASATLPRALAGAKPRYSFGSKNFTLSFESDIDRAAYIVAQKKPSKRDADYMAWLRDQMPGRSDEEIRAHGQEVRERIKAMARDAEGGTELRVPRAPAEAATSTTTRDEAEPAKPKKPRTPQLTPASEGTPQEIDAKGQVVEEVAYPYDEVQTRRAERAVPFDGHKTTLPKSWIGRRTPEDSAIISDGHTVVMADKVLPTKGWATVAKLNARVSKNRPVTAEVAQQVWDRTVDGELEAVSLLGVVPADRSDPSLFFDKGEPVPIAFMDRGRNKTPAAVNAHKLALVRKLTEFDELRASKAGGSASPLHVIAFRDGEPVALIAAMKLGSMPVNMDILRQRFGAKEEVAPTPEPEPEATVRKVRLIPTRGEDGGVEIRTEPVAEEAAPEPAAETEEESWLKRYPRRGTPGRPIPDTARDDGWKAREAGQPRVPPREIRESNEALFEWFDGYDSVDLVAAEDVATAEPAAEVGTEPAPTPEEAPDADRTSAVEDDGGGVREGEGPEALEADDASGAEGLPGRADGEGEGVVRQPRDGDAGDAPGSEGVGAPGSAGDGRQGRAGSDDVEAAGPPTPARDPKRIRGEDFRLTPEHLADLGGPKTKARANLEAIRIARQLQEERRPATREEQEKLARYVGWGGLADMFPVPTREGFRTVEKFKPEWESLGRELKELLSDEEYATAKRSTQYAHYTSPQVVRGIYGALERLGVSGRVRGLEPGAGIGNFIGLSPLEGSWTAVEMDHISSAILRGLYPSADVHEAPYQNVTLRDGYFDVVVGNPPFGDIPIRDRRYGRAPLQIHDYFFVKSLDKLRPGGILAFVTSTGTMDKAGRGARQRIADRADFLGAVRLPGTAFQKNAGTSVTTDILFFQKREQGAAPNHVADWMALSEVESGENTWKINEYFARHPTQMLGNLVPDKLHPSRPGLEGKAGADLESDLRKALEALPENVYRRPTKVQAEEQAIPGAPEGAKEGQYVVRGGKIRQVQGGQLVDLGIDAKKGTGKRISQLVELGEAARAVLDANRQGVDDKGLKKLQADLRKKYNAFVKEHGPINKKTVTVNKNGTETVRRPNLNRYNDPVNGPLVQALEAFDETTGEARPTAIQTERMIGKPPEIGKIDTGWKGVTASLVQFGRIDMPFIVSQYGKTEEEVVAELGDRIFLDPHSGLYEIPETYLSGNVREKLAIAREAAEANPRFRPNVEALEKALPPDVTLGQMKKQSAASIGVTWIPASVYADFVYEVMGMDEPKITYREVDGKWSVTKGRILNRSKYAEWSTTKVDALALFRDMLNGFQTKVTYKDEDGKTHEDTEGTQAANAKKEAIQRRFTRWIFDDDESRAHRLQARYNELMNHTVLAEWDGEHLRGKMPGLAQTFRGAPLELARHQLAAVWRILASGNTLLAHEVGAGKTISMVVAGQEAKRMGIARKPMYVVPNSMLGQFSRELLEVYPGAKILVADEYQFHTSRRREFLGRIAADEWDAVIITHSALKLIPTTPELTREIIGRMLAEYHDALIAAKDEDADRFTVKAIERAIEKYQQKLDALTDVARRDNTVYWEDLGVDMLFLDEAHEFKNLSLPTTGSIPLTDAEKTTDLYIKTRHLEVVNPGRGLVFATATPVSNSIAEMYVMQRYLDEGNLKKLGYGSFDAWAADFVTSREEMEYTAIGTLKPVHRPREYRNTFAMAQMFRSIADVKLAKDLDLKTPPIIGGEPELVIVPGSQRLKDFMKALQRRWDTRPKKPEKGDDGVFPIMNDGRFGSIDARLVTSKHAAARGHDSSKPWEHSKAQYAAERVFKIWEETKEHRGTQMIFSDLGVPKEFRGKEIDAVVKALREESPEATDEELRAMAEDAMGGGDYDIYNDIKARLVEMGVPESEIAFIQSASGKKKQALIDRVKRGEIRVLMGSTVMMGQGVNAQDRMVALHHLDVPYKPAWLHQRDGRIVRQGNLLYQAGKIEGVRIFRYALEGSYDPKGWQILENKVGFIEQGMTARADTGIVEEVGGNTLSTKDMYAIIKANASDNPYAMDHAMAQARLKVLQNEEQEHRDKQYRYRQQVARYRSIARELEDRAKKAARDVSSLKDATGDNFRVKIGDRTYTDRAEAGEAILKAFDDASVDQNGRPIGVMRTEEIGEYAGLRLSIQVVPWAGDYKYKLEGATDYEARPNVKGGSATGVVATLENMVERIRMTPDALTAEVERTKADLVATEELAKQPWEKAEELERARAEFSDLDAKMKAFGKEPGQDQSQAQDEGLVRERGPEYTRSQLESTFGSLRAAREVARDLAEIAGDLLEVSIPGVPTTAERAAAVKAGREAAFAWVPATGQKVARSRGRPDVASLLRLLRAYRHPSAEYWHVMVVVPKGRGMEVAHHRMTSSGALDVTLASLGDVAEAAGLAKKLGGQVILAHNHPSGNPTPSPEDRAVTLQAEATVREIGAAFYGHVIINGELAFMLDGKGGQFPIAIRRSAEEGPDWNQPSPKRVRDESDVFRHLKSVPQDETRIDVLALNTQHEIVAYEPRPLADMDDPALWIPALLRDLGAAKLVIGTYGDVAYQKVVDKVRNNRGFAVLDVVDGVTGASAAMAREINVLGDKPTMSPIFEESPAYGAQADVPRDGDDAPASGAAAPGSAPVRERPGVEYGDINKPGESARAREARLEKRRRRLEAYAERIKGAEELDKKLRDRVRRMIERSLVARQAHAILEELKDATSARGAWRALRRAQRVIERELHRRALADLQRVLRKANRMKMRPEFLKIVDAATEDIDLKVMGPKTRKMLRATAKYLEENPDAPVPDHVRRQLARLDKRSVKKLSVDELREITNAVEMAIHLNRTKNLLIGRRRRQEREKVAKRVIDQMHARAKVLPRGKSIEDLEGAPKRSNFGVFMKEAGTRPEVLLEHLSPELQELVYEDIVVQAHAEEQRLVWQFRDELARAIEGTGRKVGTKDFEGWRTEALTLETAQGPIQISRDEAIWLLTSLKDPSNVALMYRNGVTLDRSQRHFSVDDGVVEQLRELTGVEEESIARAMFAQFNGPMKEALNGAWVDVYGYEIARVPEYVPRSIDMNRADTGKDPLEQLASDREAALTTWGHLRQRTGARAPLRIGSALDTYLNHSEHVARLSAYLAPATNAHTILGRRDVKQAMIQRVGEPGYNRILDSIVQQTVRQADRTNLERWVRNRLRLTGASILSLRLSTIALNPAGLAISAAYRENGFEHLVKALPAGARRSEWKRIEALAKKHSPYWRTRYESFVHQSTSGLANDRVRRYGRPDLAEIGLKPLEASDRFGAVVRWRMAELYVEEAHPELRPGSGDYYDAVAREFERSIFRGENSAHGGDMTGAIAFGRKNVFFSTLVMFTSSVSKVYSLAMRAALAAQRGERAVAVRSLAGVMGSLTWAALMRELLTGARGGDDDDETVPERVALRMATEASGAIPVLGQSVLAPAVRMMAGKPAPVFSASVTDDVLMDLGNTVVQGVRTVRSGMSGELDAQGEEVWPKHFARTASGSLQLAALWFGVPYTGPRDAFRMFRNAGGQDSSLRANLRVLEGGDQDVTQERRRLLRSIRLNDPRAFREAVQGLRAKGQELTHAEVLATINRRYGFLTKYEEAQARAGLDQATRILVEQHLRERDALRGFAEALARENGDLLSGRPSRARPTRPKRPTRPTRPERPRRPSP